MKTTPQASSPVISLAIIGIAAMAFYYVSEGVSKGTAWISALPVEGTVFTSAAADAPPITAPLQVGAIHPLLIESSRKAAGLQVAPENASGSMVSLDSLFGRHTEEPASRANAGISKLPAVIAGAPQLGALPAVELVKFDISALSGQVRLQATSNEGAIINGSYFSVGELVKSAGYVASSGAPKAYPVLVSVSKETAVIAEGGLKGKKLVLHLN